MLVVSQAWQTFLRILRVSGQAGQVTVENQRAKSASDAKSQQVCQGLKSSRRRIAKSRHFKHICVFQLNSWLLLKDCSVNAKGPAQADHGMQSKYGLVFQCGSSPFHFVQILEENPEVEVSGERTDVDEYSACLIDHQYV